MSGSDADDAPPSTKPTPSVAREEGRRAKREGKGVGSNPYTGPGGDLTAARAWVRGFLDEAEASTR